MPKKRLPKKLTPLSIEQLKPGPTRIEIADATVPGLYFIMQKTGKRTFAVRYRHGGRTRKLTLGYHKLAKAHSLARAALDRIEQGHDPAAEKQEQRRRERADDDTFPSVAAQYMKLHAQRHTRTWRETARLIGLKLDEESDRWDPAAGGIAHRWRHRRIGEITRRDVIAVLDQAAARGNVLRNRVLAVVRGVFNWALSRDMIGASPCVGIKPSKEKSRERVLSDDEIKALWRALDHVDLVAAAAIRMMLLTGQRRSEVAGLQRAELNLDGALWSLPGERTKNGRPHVVPLAPAVISILNSLPRVAGSPYVFTHVGRRPLGGWSTLKIKIDDAMPGAAPWVIHDLRRTAATGMRRIGVSTDVVEAAINHVSGVRRGVAGVYDRHELLDERRDALERWAAHVAVLCRHK